jgi:hypothetical protein
MILGGVEASAEPRAERLTRREMHAAGMKFRRARAL